MTIDVRWHNPDDKCIYVVTFPEHWTWHDYDETITVIANLIVRSPHPVVHQIIDLRATQTLPEGDGVSLVLKGRETIAHIPGKTRKLNVLVGTPTVMKHFLDIIHKLYGRPSTSIRVDTMEEALNHIAEHSRGK